MGQWKCNRDEMGQWKCNRDENGQTEMPAGWDRGSYHDNWMRRDKLRWRLNEKDNWEDSWLRRDKPKWQEDVAGKIGITDVCLWEQQDEKGQTEMTAERTDARWYGTTDMPAGCTVTKPMTVSRYTWMRFFRLKWFGRTNPSGLLINLLKYFNFSKYFDFSTNLLEYLTLRASMFSQYTYKFILRILCIRTDSFRVFSVYKQILSVYSANTDSKFHQKIYLIPHSLGYLHVYLWYKFNLIFSV